MPNIEFKKYSVIVHPQNHLQDLGEMLLIFQQSSRFLNALRPFGKPLELEGCRSSGKDKQRDHCTGCCAWHTSSGMRMKHATLAYLPPALKANGSNS